MSLQQTVKDLASGTEDVIKGGIEKDSTKVLTGTDELAIGSKELLGNVVHFLPTVVEAGTALGLATTAGVSASLAPLVLSAISLKDELERNQEARSIESGRITTPLPDGTFNQLHTSRKDPAHLLHRKAITVSDRAIPPTRGRLDSCILPPDESMTKPILVKPSQLPKVDKLTTYSTSKPKIDKAPGDVHPQSTGGKRKTTTSPFQ